MPSFLKRIKDLESKIYQKIMKNSDSTLNVNHKFIHNIVVENDKNHQLDETDEIVFLWKRTCNEYQKVKIQNLKVPKELSSEFSNKKQRGKCGNARGKFNEHRVFNALKTCPLPQYINNIRFSSIEEDSMGGDIIFELSDKKIFLQIKSSKNELRKFLKKVSNLNNNIEIIAIWVNDYSSDADIRNAINCKLKKVYGIVES